MEGETLIDNHTPGSVHQIFPVVGPVLLISMGYIDPGKWIAAVDGGARFGYDLVLMMLIFNCAAMLCQYLAARIGVVSGKNLSEICSEEYSKSTCFFLGVQAEVSVILLDLTMILGIAHSFSLLFGVELFTAILFTAIDVAFFPLLMRMLEKREAEVLFVSASGFMLLVYVFGVLVSRPQVPLVMNGMPTNLSEENIFALMSLLGANIIPHNFYLHSSIVQRRDLPNISKSSLCHSHLMTIVCVFGGVYLANYVVMCSAATVFHSAGLIVLTFQDALLLVDQVLNTPLARCAFFLVLFISRQMISKTGDLTGQVVVRDLLQMNPSPWLHHAVVRVLVIVPALGCTWSSGAEGVYQLFIFSQVMLAILLPSSVIPLFRVASSRSIMGALKISQLVELLAWATFMGMLGLNVIFVSEMLFGYSDWVSNLKWSMGSSLTLPYVILLITACASLVFMLVLVTTPLKSASVGLDQQIWLWECQKILPEPSLNRVENDRSNVKFLEEAMAEQLLTENSLGDISDNSIAKSDLDFPETIVHSDEDLHLPAIEEDHPVGPNSPTYHQELITELSQVAVVDKEVSDVGSVYVHATRNIDPIHETKGIQKDSLTEKDNLESDSWEPEELYEKISTPMSEGPGSFRSLSGISDEGSNTNGSFSRLSGLGRAARRQLAAILDEFWRQLFDFHGQAAQQVKSKKLDSLSGRDQRSTVSSLREDPSGMNFSGYFPSIAERGYPGTYDSPKQQMMSNSMGSPRVIQNGSSMWSTQMQCLDAYVQSSSLNMLNHGLKHYSSLCLPPSSEGQDSSSFNVHNHGFKSYSSLRLPPSSEGRDSSSFNVHNHGFKSYSSLRLPPSSEGLDYQSTNVHGNHISSYLSRIPNDGKSGFLSSQTHISPKFLPANYRDTPAYAPAIETQNELMSIHMSSVQNPATSRPSILHTEKAYVDHCPPQSRGSIGSPPDTKKYHSLPDISGLTVPRRDSYSADRYSQISIPPGFAPSVGRGTYGKSISPDSGALAGVPSALNDLSRTKLQRNVFSTQSSSDSDTEAFWSRQPSKKLFGVEDKTCRVRDEGLSTELNPAMQEGTHMDLETKLLQSFRYCIVKLLKLEGSDWLFKPNGGADENLIGLVAANEKIHLEAEVKDQVLKADVPSDRYGPTVINKEAASAKFWASVPSCGEGCIWRVDLVVSFGVWCVHRILDLSLMESRPELWGKYTYVLNRLQGILDLAFSKPRPSLSPCFCLQASVAHARSSSSQLPEAVLSPSVKAGGKFTSSSTILELIKDVEIAISCRKGRTGTAAGEVAFPKGKENLASVLKRYKRRLSNKTFEAPKAGPGFCKIPIPISCTP